MTYFVLFFVFIFGTLIGSFLNVVILRFNTGKKIIGRRERSMCFSCAKTLEWHELLPVVSFVCLRGKCRGCSTKISLQYPLVELATGLIFAGIFIKNFSGFTLEELFTNPAAAVLLKLTTFHLVIWSILIVVTVYDLRHKIIPDEMVYAFSGLSLTAAFLFPSITGVSLSGAIMAGAAFFFFFAGLWVISSGRWLGFGDAKLVLGLGFFLGLTHGLSALVLAFWTGAVVSIGLLVWQYIRTRAIQSRSLQGRGATLTMKSEIPFAPFIILGILIAFFWQIDIFGIAAFL